MNEPRCAQFLFRDVRPAALGMTDVSLERRLLGTVPFADGRVYACDPLVPMDTLPLARRLTPGNYESVLFVLAGFRRGSPSEPTEENAAAAILCGNGAPVRWELAQRERGAPEAAAYGVDSGTGCFMGNLAAELLFDDKNDFGEEIIRGLGAASGTVVSIKDVRLAAFHSGIGDGTYDTWLGYDATGELAIILTDFEVAETEDVVSSVHADWDRRAQRRWWQFWK